MKSFATEIRYRASEWASYFTPLAQGDTLLKRWGACVLLFFALGYYGYYSTVWPGSGGEGGVDALIALRLLHGERPFVDTFLGYNVLWFYPLVGLFKIFGPNYLAMRFFFLLICTVTGLLSYRLVLRCTGMAAPAFLAGLLAILIPGQTYRNYMAFLVVLNMTTFLEAFVLTSRCSRSRLLWMAASGVTLGVAYLVRVDIGYFLSFILIGLLLIFPMGKQGVQSLPHRFLIPVTGFLFVILGLLLTHLPVYLDAVHRGFDRQLVSQYEAWPSSIHGYGVAMLAATKSSIAQELEAHFPSKQLASPAPPIALPPSVSSSPQESLKATAPTPVSLPQKVHSSVKITAGAQERSSITDSEPRSKMLALNLYLPIPLSLLLLLGGSALWMVSLCQRHQDYAEKALILLTCLGCSLTLFPQYFFWQPNMVHLSEFMVPMMLTLIISCVFAVCAWQRAGKLLRAFLGLYLSLSVLALILYYINACQSGGSGGIAVSLHKSVTFEGKNGVHVRMTPQEFEETYSIYKLITAVSEPEDYVVCYPYHPEIDFMTDRPSCDYNLYADNDIAPARFYRETVQKMEKFQPVVYVINNWQINGSEESRFYNWASSFYQLLISKYHLAYKHGDFEVYVRLDRVDKIPAGFLK